MFKKSVLLVGALLLAGPIIEARQPAQQAQRPAAPPSIEDRTSGMKKIDGYFPLYWDERSGGMFLEISRFDTEFLFSTGLSAGLGSNDIGLDRGSGRGGGRLVYFNRVGPRVMLVQPNQSFRSSSKNPLERKSVEDSFAKSILWGFTVAAESGGRVLVDATDFYLRDVASAAGSLRPGNYRLDRTRSAFYLPNTKNFPMNTEVDMTLTFVNEPTGGGGGGGGPDPGPDADHQSRRRRWWWWRRRFRRQSLLRIGRQRHAVPRCGDAARACLVRAAAGSHDLHSRAMTIRAPATAAPRSSISASRSARPIQFRYIRRHRLQKKDPSAAISEPVKPIEYWVDSGAPEDVKKALIEGAMWWNQAFEAAGFRNALSVRVLPARCRPDGHPLQHDQLGPPLDARLELRRLGVGSAHRRDHQGHRHARLAARSAGLHDLRRPAVALHARQRAAVDPVRDRARSASASCRRTKWVTRSASATTTTTASKGWISVLDYPHPLETLREDGTIDLSKAYEAEDRRLGQGGDQLRLPPVPCRAPTSRPSWRRSSMRRGTKTLRYFTNQDTDIHPRVEQWSNGVNQADELTRLMKVRRAALESHRPQHDPHRRADGDDRRAAGADLHVSPLRGGIDRVDDRRPGLRLRDARRQSHAGGMGQRRNAAARRLMR